MVTINGTQEFYEYINRLGFAGKATIHIRQWRLSEQVRQIDEGYKNYTGYNLNSGYPIRIHYNRSKSTYTKHSWEVCGKFGGPAYITTTEK